MKTPASRLCTLLLAGAAALASRAAVVTFQDTSASVPEGAGDATLFLVLDAPSASPVVVNLVYETGTAGIRDYVDNPRAVTIGAGETRLPIAAAITDDFLLEGEEAFVVRITGASGATVGSDSAADVIILDDDDSDGDEDEPTNAVPVAVTFLADEIELDEDSGDVQILLALNRSTNVPVSVRVAANPGSAGLSDYALPSGTALAVFAPGTMNSHVILRIEDDNLSEQTENLELVFSSFSPAGVVQFLATNLAVRIIDNDTPELLIRPGNQAFAEDHSGWIARNVELSKPSDYTVRVSVAVAGTATANGEDYTLEALSGADLSADPAAAGADTGGLTQASPVRRLTYLPGVTQQVMRIRLEDDQLDEPDETVDFTLSNPENAALSTNRFRAVLTIQDNDQPRPTLSFRQRRTLADEGVAQTIDAVLSSAFNHPVTFDLTVDGTAQEGVDYRVEKTGLTIPAGQDSVQVVIDTLDDLRYEPDETVVLTLDNVVNAFAGETNAVTHWITDNDAPPEDLVFHIVKSSASESKRVLTSIGPKTPAVVPRGAAVDAAGNIYISDRGNGLPGNGTVRMIPAGKRKSLRILEGLTNPGDIEIGRNGRSLVVAQSGGGVVVRGFGLSVKILNQDAFAGGFTLYVQTPRETRPLKLSTDGYYHAVDLMQPDGTPDTVSLIIESRTGARVIRGIPLGHSAGPGQAGQGHTILNVEP